MKYTTKTEYGLVCLVYLAHHATKGPSGNGVVTVSDIVKEEHFSPSYIEKIFQKLRGADIVVSHHGKQGGYSLARPASEITLREIIEALEGATFHVYCKPSVRKHIVCTHFCMCSVRPVWRRTKELLDGFYESVTLDMIAKEEDKARDVIGEKGELPKS